MSVTSAGHLKAGDDDSILYFSGWFRGSWYASRSSMVAEWSARGFFERDDVGLLITNGERAVYNALSRCPLVGVILIDF